MSRRDDTTEMVTRLERACISALSAAISSVVNRIRACPQCGYIFLKHRKQRYCSPECSQRMRWAKFAATRLSRDYHREREQAQARRASE